MKDNDYVEIEIELDSKIWAKIEQHAKEENLTIDEWIGNATQEKTNELKQNS